HTADVVVTDGFTGNVVIKTIEGFNDNFLRTVRQIGRIASSAYHMHGRDLLHDLGMGRQIQQLDYREYGGACLLGINGNVIIAHGRSQAKAVQSAILLAKKTAEGGIARRISEECYGQTSNGGQQ
ncbi:MAG: phosphate acyltransferase, partial [Dehalococcoidales bacterium]|nr:phosphate acyltransferase [Dehalococcoidales bacterium]